MKTITGRGRILSGGPVRKALALSAVIIVAILVSAGLVPSIASEADWPFFRTIVAETDRPLRAVRPVPMFSQVPGPYQVAWAARGMADTSGAVRLVLSLPGPPLGATLYLSGRDDPHGAAPHFPDGDAAVRVAIASGAGATRVVKVVPVLYRTGMHFINRLDVTRFLAQGTNTLTISGYDLNLPEGAFAYAVCRGGTDLPPKLIQVADGLDIGYFAYPPPYGPDSELASFVFEPSAAERRGRIVLAVAGAEPGRGDEVFAITGPGTPAGYLPDTDGDRLPDIVNRRVRLRLVDRPPLGVERAASGGALEALRSAVSLEEDGLGVPRSGGGCGVGAEFNVLTKPYPIPVGRTFASFQVQSEDPEEGDSFTLLAALNELTLEGVNPIPEIEVLKDVTPAQMPEPGGAAIFTVTVNNLGAERLHVVSLVDDLFGNLDGRGTCRLPQTLAVDGSYVCTFEAVANGTVEVPHRDTVTASGVGMISGDTVSDSDDAVVTFTRIARPDFTLAKTASSDEGYPGDLVTYVFTVINTGNVRLESVAVVDDKLGAIGTVTLEPGGVATLTYPDFVLPECVGTTLTSPTLCDGQTVIEDRCSMPNLATATWGTLSRWASDCVNILPHGSIGDYVWEDLDNDGVHDPGEPGIAGVTLTLSRDGVVVGAAVTEAAGGYLFTGLKAGHHTVDSGGKDGYALTTANDPMGVALGIGQDFLDADFGYWRPAPGIAVTKVAEPTFGHLFAADPTSPWPYQLIATPLAVAYTVEVTNPGGEPLRNVTVSDDPPTLVFTYQSGDTNGDGALDLTETWIYRAAWTYDAAGTYPDTVTAHGTGAVTGTEVTATDDAVVEAVGCGQCFGKVGTLTLRYNGSAAAIVTVLAEDAHFADPVAFAGTVGPGGVFSFGPLSSSNGGFDGTLGTSIEIWIDGVLDTFIHTSCSQPIYPGQDWGSFTVLGGASKHGGLLCPLVAE